MTWKIIDKDQDAIDLILRSIRDYTSNNPDELEAALKAFDRVTNLAKKGIVAEKYMKEWGK